MSPPLALHFLFHALASSQWRSVFFTSLCSLPHLPLSLSSLQVIGNKYETYCQQLMNGKKPA